MRPPFLFMIAGLIFGLGLVRADMANLQSQANDAFAKKDYAAAMPLYEKLSVANQYDAKKVVDFQAKIDICRKNLTPEQIAKLKLPVADSQPAGAQREIHAPPKPGEVRTLGIKELGNFDYDPEKGGGIPDDVKALDGLHVRMTGYMIPIAQADGITDFALVPSLTSCCFGQPPGIQHTITVHCKAGHPAAYIMEPIVVEGILRVKEKREDDYTTSIFEIQDGTAQPAGVELPVDVLKGRKGFIPDAGTLK